MAFRPRRRLWQGAVLLALLSGSRYHRLRWYPQLCAYRAILSSIPLVNRNSSNIGYFLEYERTFKNTLRYFKTPRTQGTRKILNACVTATENNRVAWLICSTVGSRIRKSTPSWGRGHDGGVWLFQGDDIGNINRFKKRTLYVIHDRDPVNSGCTVTMCTCERTGSSS